jgi:hypothetical protein
MKSTRARTAHFEEVCQTREQPCPARWGRLRLGVRRMARRLSMGIAADVLRTLDTAETTDNLTRARTKEIGRLWTFMVRLLLWAAFIIYGSFQPAGKSLDGTRSTRR